MPAFVKSIEKVEKIHSTAGSRPLEVTCDDFAIYICKYGSRVKLFNEYLAYEFLNIFKIPVPKYAFVILREEHYPDSKFKIPKSHLNYPLFGSKIIADVIDVTQTFETFKGKWKQLNKIENRYFNLLNITIFDIWLANLDRNHNNLNLLIATPDSKYEIVAIDHTEIFDGCRLGQDLACITLDDSILRSSFCKIVLSNRKLIRTEYQEVIEAFYLCVKNCEQSLNDIVQQIPDQWGLDSQLLIKQIRESIFQEDWIQQTVTNFKEYVQICLKRD